jgi:hemerythrin-like domain-containing protein
LRTEDPLESLLRFHRRIERGLASLGELHARLDGSAAGPESSGVAAELIDLFTTRMAIHHADEEHDLIPMLLRRIARAEERDNFREIRLRLESDHRELRDAWRHLRAPLEATAGGAPRRLPGDVVAYFRALHGLHICTEEGALHRVARQRLLDSDRAQLAGRMATRRAGHASVMSLPRI